MFQEDYPPVATYFMIRLGVQGYAEIDPSFFNQSYENPLICVGWRKFADALQLPENVEIEFAYYGNNLFRVRNFRPIQIQSEFKPFHSRSLYPLLTKKIDIRLNTTTIAANKLLLPPEFATFLTNNYYQDLLVCADYNHKKLMQVFNSNNPDKTELGDDWTLFCRERNFHLGDTIRFKFHVHDPHMRCHVFIVGPI
ncbi:hypothetical protein QL285_063036 [Trifolium repens]|nr:hypothetical protein QL285_063036 [Trifolium repens]